MPTRQRGVYRLVGRIAATAVLAAALASCGGGGDGGGGSSLPQAIALGTANQDSAMRATAVAIQGGLVGSTAGLTGSSSGVVRAAQDALLAAPRKLAAAVSGRKQAGAVFDAGSRSCTVAGSMSATLKDVDGSLSLSVGDVLTLAYTDCDDGVEQVWNGTATAVYTRVETSSVGFGANFGLSQFSSASSATGRAATYNGNFALDYDETSATASITQVTVQGSLLVQVTHPMYDDDVTLHDGFAVTTDYDITTPAGATSGGQSFIQVAGDVSSAQAGGRFLIATYAPGLEQWDEDLYPRSGAAVALGTTGTPQISVLSSTQVRYELDVDDDGVPETVTDVSWDWLL